MGCHFEISILYMQHNTLSHLDWNLEWTKMSLPYFTNVQVPKLIGKNPNLFQLPKMIDHFHGAKRKKDWHVLKKVKGLMYLNL
jgi:hypothetical protein